VLGLLVLVGLRNILRQRNLHDTAALPSAVGPKVPDPGPQTRTTRAPDGSYNDLGQPGMGMAGTRFGRNVPLEHGYQETPDQILDPNPREVSRELLTRHPHSCARPLMIRSILSRPVMRSFLISRP